MSQTFDLSSTASVIVFADVSRVQGSAGANEELRLLVDGLEVAQMNAGGSSGWDYDAISMHGAKTSLSAGSHTVEVQYRVQSGTVRFLDD
eukprot:gene1932-2258_t